MLLPHELRYLPLLLRQLHAQTHVRWELHLHDNSDGACREEAQRLAPGAVYSASGNIGWGAAHNAMLAQARGEWYLTANVRLLMDPHYLQELLRAAAVYGDDVGAVVPLVRRWQAPAGDLAVLDDAALEACKTDVVDTAGLQLLPSFRALDMGQGLPLGHDYAVPAEVLGGSGCSVLLRRAALDAVAYPGGAVYDQAMVMYKEDVDLALRLQLAGWRAVYTPVAHAWYQRTAVNVRGTGMLAVARNRLLAGTPTSRLYGGLHHSYLLAKYAHPNAAQWPRGMRRAQVATAALRQAWSLLLEPRLWLRARQAWPAYAAAAEHRGGCLSAVGVARLLQLVRVPRVALPGGVASLVDGMCTNNDQQEAEKVGKKSSLLADVRSIEQTNSTIMPVLGITIATRAQDDATVALLQRGLRALARQQGVLGQVLVLCVYNATNEAGWMRLQQAVAAVRLPEWLAVAPVRQRQVRSHGPVTSYTTAHTWGQRLLAARHRMLHNDDVELEPNALAELLRALDTDHSLGIVAPQLHYDDGGQVEQTRGWPNLLLQLANRIPLLVRVLPALQRAYHAGETKWVTGHAVVLRGELWQRLGGLDERYFLYMSDVDMAKEAARLGWRTAMLPAARGLLLRPLSSRGGLGAALRFERMIWLHTWDAMKYYAKWMTRRG